MKPETINGIECKECGVLFSTFREWENHNCEDYKEVSLEDIL